jgi:hypothetical protein
MVIEGMSWSKESYGVLGIEGHKEHKRTLTQSEWAQKVHVEFGLITCETLPSKALPHTSARLGAKLAYHRRHKGKGRDEQDGTERG